MGGSIPGAERQPLITEPGNSKVPTFKLSRKVPLSASMTRAGVAYEVRLFVVTTAVTNSFDTLEFRSPDGSPNYWLHVSSTVESKRWPLKKNGIHRNLALQVSWPRAIRNIVIMLEVDKTTFPRASVRNTKTNFF